MQEMTIDEIKSSFDSEWVLVGDPVTDEALNVLRGKVLHHSKDRDEVYRKGIELRPKRVAILYLGRPKGMAFVVSDKRLLPNIHPGEVLREEFLIPLKLSQSRVARDINVPPRRINEIVLEKRAITADTALRLARYFGTSERFWLGLQADYELEEARRMLAGRLEKEVRRHAA